MIKLIIDRECFDTSKYFKRLFLPSYECKCYLVNSFWHPFGTGKGFQLVQGLLSPVSSTHSNCVVLVPRKKMLCLLLSFKDQVEKLLNRVSLTNDLLFCLPMDKQKVMCKRQSSLGTSGGQSWCRKNFAHKIIPCF